MPNQICSKCHEDFMNCKCEQFHPNIGMIPDGDDYLYSDEHGITWRLVRTHQRDIPFRIIKEQIN